MRKQGRGFSLIELLIVVAIILTIAAIAMPNFLRARMQANETATVGALRTITTAVVTYESTYQRGYPNALVDLAPPPVGTPPTSAAADLIDRLLASGTRSGYSFAYVPTDTNGDGRMDFYTVNADPASPGVSGQRHFYVDHTNVIRYNNSVAAGAGDRPIPQ